MSTLNPDPVAVGWDTGDLDAMRARVRELTRAGMRRSDASVLAFGEMVRTRAARHQEPPTPEAGLESNGASRIALARGLTSSTGPSAA
jgi:hypothetical protein